MDLREKKTERAIRNAFLELRSRKPLEKITVKELAERAEISKATFYLHYCDIYALSEKLQDEVVQDILRDVTNDEASLLDMNQTARRLSESFASYQNLIDILFSGSQAGVLPTKIEQKIKENVYRIRPEKKTDPVFQVLLTYQIQGAYYAHTENRRQVGDEQVLRILDQISLKLREIDFA